jgi:hypothetical protein
MTDVVRGRFIRKASSLAHPKANSAAAIPFSKNEKSCSGFLQIINAIKAAWPNKTVAYVSHLTGASERAVHFWLAGSTRMSVDAIGALLRTPEGFLVLTAIMGDCNEEWWVEARLAEGVRQSRRAIKEQQKRIDALRALQSQIDLFEK